MTEGLTINHPSPVADEDHRSRSFSVAYGLFNDLGKGSELVFS
jgi:hypothetical protein